MRGFAFILSLFLLTLSLVPCSDNVESSKEGMELSSDHSDHDHEEDSCTPFCACSCCGSGGFVLFTPVFEITFTAINPPANKVSNHRSDFISTYFYSFWQPPKLG